MSDLISRQVVIDALDGTILIETAQDAVNVLAYLKAMSDRIKALPSAEPERKLGRWVAKDGRWHCSVCDAWAPKGYRYNYCPDCGAKMGVEDAEGDR